MRLRRTAVATVLFAGLSIPMAGTALAADVYNCGDFTYQEDAQAVFNQDTSDPNGLDGPVGTGFTGVAGVACEELPSRGTTTTTTTSATTAGQVATRPVGAVAAGDGSSSTDGSTLPYVLG